MLLLIFDILLLIGTVFVLPFVLTSKKYFPCISGVSISLSIMTALHMALVMDGITHVAVASQSTVYLMWLFRDVFG